MTRSRKAGASECSACNEVLGPVVGGRVGKQRRKKGYHDRLERWNACCNDAQHPFDLAQCWTPGVVEVEIQCSVELLIQKYCSGDSYESDSVDEARVLELVSYPWSKIDMLLVNLE